MKLWALIAVATQVFQLNILTKHRSVDGMEIPTDINTDLFPVSIIHINDFHARYNLFN